MTFGASFLQVPEFFPARLAGERWGSGTLRLSFPGGPYEIAGVSKKQEESLRARYQGLEGVASQAAVSMSVFRAAPEDFRDVDLRGRPYRFDLDYQEGALRVAAPRWMALLQLSPGLAGAVWTLDTEEFLGILENALRIVVAYRLLALGGALVHSAAVANQQKAHLFVGRSGAGKTTLCELTARERREGCLILSDELNAIYGSSGVARVAKLPFAGDFGATGLAPSAPPDYPLHGLYRLKKAGRTELSDLGLGEATALVFSCTPYVNADPYRRESLFPVLETLLKNVPRHTLSFPAEGPLWDRLEASPDEVPAKGFGAMELAWSR